MIFAFPLRGRWLEEPDEGRVFAIARERVIEVSLPLISPLRGQLPPQGKPQTVEKLPYPRIRISSLLRIRRGEHCSPVPVYL